MWRRTSRRLCEDVFKRAQREAAEDLSKRQGRTDKGRGFYDPISSQSDYERHQRGTRVADSNSNTFESFSLSNEDYKRWMDINRAAKVLGIPKDKLYLLKVDEVDNAWRTAYGRASGKPREQEEILAAATSLQEYLLSPLYKAKEMEFFQEEIRKAKNDIDQTVRQDRQQAFGRFLKHAGVAQGLMTLVVVFGSFKLVGTIRSEDMENIGRKAMRRMALMLSMPTNLEPPPDYTTRYRDTPTVLDEHLRLLQQASGGGNDDIEGVNDPAMLEALELATAVNRREEALLAELSHDSAASSSIIPDKDLAAAGPSTAANLMKAKDMSVMEMTRVVMQMAPSSLQREFIEK